MSQSRTWSHNHQMRGSCGHCSDHSDYCCIIGGGGGQVELDLDARHAPVVPEHFVNLVTRGHGPDSDIGVLVARHQEVVIEVHSGHQVPVSLLHNGTLHEIS